MPSPPDPLRRGGPLSAAWLNQLVAFVAANRVTVDPTSGLTASAGPSGIALGREDVQELYIELTYASTDQMGSGSYSWLERFPAMGGGWSDGTLRGYAANDPARGSAKPDPAWEANKNAGLSVGRIAAASRDGAIGRLTFIARPCP